MSKSLVFGSLLVVILLLGSSSRGDVGTAPPPSLPPASAAPEAITGTPAASAVGDETIAKDPFQPYDVGPLGTRTWSYNNLSSAEKAYADRAADGTGWAASHDAFAAAAKERAQQAAADSAAHQLGIVDNLASTGVVP